MKAGFLSDDAGMENSNRRPQVTEGEGFDAIIGNILILSNYYSPEPTGSAPPISDLSFWLAENGFEPQVLTARPSYPLNSVYVEYADGQRDRETLNGVEVTRVASPVLKSRGAIGRLITEGGFAVSALTRSKKKYLSVICVCPSVFTVLIAPIFKKKGGKVVAIVHDIQSGLAKGLNFKAMAGLSGLLSKLEAFALNRCDSLIALSPAMAEELRALGVRAPIKIIPPQVDVREIMPAPMPAGAQVKILYSGNLGRKQGLDQVLALAKELMERSFPGQIVIRGQGSEREALEELALAMGLQNVKFMDLAPRDQLSAAMGEASIHLIPQSASGANFALPSKMFTIMAAQRPYVATATPNSPLDIVTREAGAGICVPPDDPVSFADAVERLASDETLRLALGASGRSYAVNVIDREVVCKDILQQII